MDCFGVIEVIIFDVNINYTRGSESNLFVNLLLPYGGSFINK